VIGKSRIIIERRSVMGIIVTPSGKVCGASVTGLDLSQTLSDEQIAEIRSAWLEHKVLSFPNQAMSDDDLERFTLAFGGFGEDPFIAPIKGRKNIIAVERRADEKAPLFAEIWHTDWSFQKAPPAGNVSLRNKNTFKRWGHAIR
jgi:taurine dioxygenase